MLKAAYMIGLKPLLAMAVNVLAFQILDLTVHAKSVSRNVEIMGSVVVVYLLLVKGGDASVSGQKPELL